MRNFKKSFWIFALLASLNLALLPSLYAAPVANAGTNSTSALYVPIILNAAASDPAGGSPLTYLWEQVSGPSLDMIGQDREQAMIISADKAGDFVFRVRVSNDTGTATDDVTVTIVESTGRTIYVDHQLTANCLTGNYSIANRNGSGSDGIAYTNIQGAASIVIPGDTVLIRDGLYPHPFNAAGGNAQVFVQITRSGTATQPIRFMAFPGESVTIEGWGFTDQDLNGDGSADGEFNSKYRQTLMLVKADYIHISGLELRKSQQAAMQISGSYCYVEECVSHDNFAANFQLFNLSTNTIQGTVFRWIEGYRSRHDSGCSVYMTPAQPGFVRNFACVDSVFYSNGYQEDGGRVLPSGSDKVGGGNSDGFVISTGFYNAAVKSAGLVNNYAVGFFVVRCVSFKNCDDGFDFSFADSLAEDNISISNGPAGQMGYKQFSPTRGLVYRGNFAWGHNRAFDLRAPVGEMQTLINNTGMINAGQGIQGQKTNHVNKNNLSAFNVSTDLSVPGINCWTEDGVNAAPAFRGEPRLFSTNIVIDMTFTNASTVREKRAAVAAQVKRLFSPTPVSGLINNGLIIPGYHCPRADDDPISPMPKNAPGRHWYGTAPDIGAFEFNPGVVRPAAPRNLRVLQ